MTVFQRYVLLQVPEWVLVAIVLYGLRLWLNLPGWAALLVFAIVVVKDFLLYPFLRRAFETDRRTVLDRMLGESGVVIQAIAPRGYVKVRGELWRAEAYGGGEIPAGARVRVVASHSMTLTVTPE